MRKRVTYLLGGLLFYLLLIIGPSYALELPILVQIKGKTPVHQVTVTLYWSGSDAVNQDAHFYNNIILDPEKDGWWQHRLRVPDSGTVWYFFTIQSERGEQVSPVRSLRLAPGVEVREQISPEGLLQPESYTPRDRPPYLSFQHDPSTTMTISWETVAQGNSIVEYGLDSTYGNLITDSQNTHYHSIELVNLQPNTVYHYRVRTEGVYQSPDFTFKTAPVDPALPFTFVAWGDSRSNNTARRHVKNQVKRVNPDFTLFTGDLVYDGMVQYYWDIWFNTMADLLNISPFLSAIGNHENNSWIYYQLFYFPTHNSDKFEEGKSYPESYYSFDYGSAHFVVLNSEDVYGAGNAQYNWMVNDLQQAENNPNIYWKIVTFHRPPYSSGHHGSDYWVRQYWVPVFEQYHVDLVFTGHDHDYERTVPINNVVYVVTGGAGAPLYPVGSHSWTAYSLSVYHFCKVVVNGNTLYMEAIDSTGYVFDSVTLHKTPNQISVTRNSLQSFQLFQNYPNPFNGTTAITYQLPEPADFVEINVYDLLGNRVWGRRERGKPAGTYSIIWNGMSSTGVELSSGVYFYEVRTEKYHQMRQMRLVK